MLTVDNTFKTACTATVRRPVAKLVFDVVDITTFGVGTTTSTGAIWWSDVDQVFDGVRDMSQKFITWEKDYIILDGTFAFPAYSTQQRGWWTDTLSGADNTFAVSPWIKRTFPSDHSSAGINITFDTATGDCASDFTIDILDASSTVLYTHTVTGNTSSTYTWEINLVNYRAVLITVQKTSKPYRRLRITELDFGIVKAYTGRDIIKMSVTESMDATSKEVKANKLEVQLENKAKTFNPLNPTGIYTYLQRKQKLYAYTGFEIGGTPQYVPLGVFYLSENKSDQGSLTATLTAYDLMDLLSQNTYRKSTFGTATLQDLAVAVLLDASVWDYNIDASLASINCTSAIPWISHRDALQLIAMAGRCAVYVDRRGVITFKRLTTADTGQVIDYDNVREIPEIKLNKIINSIAADVYTYQQAASTSEAYKGTVEVAGTEDVWVAYKDMYASAGASRTVSAGTVNSTTYYAYGALLNITHTGVVDIVVTGYKVVPNASTTITVSASKPSTEDLLTATIKNQLITDTANAKAVSDWLLVELEQRLAYKADDRMRPFLECGDVVTINDDFSANKKARISSQKFEYDGGLSGIIEANGEVL